MRHHDATIPLEDTRHDQLKGIHEDRRISIVIKRCLDLPVYNEKRIYHLIRIYNIKSIIRMYGFIIKGVSKTTKRLESY